MLGVGCVRGGLRGGGGVLLCLGGRGLGRAFRGGEAGGCVAFLRLGVRREDGVGVGVRVVCEYEEKMEEMGRWGCM